MRKYDMISTLAEETAGSVVRNEDRWRGYLETASRLYKYSFKEQLLIYAQRPDAAACDSIEVWNGVMGCWVNRGAKGIALIDESGSSHNGLRYVFDVSDVHKTGWSRRSLKLWEMKEEHQEAVLGHLEELYGETGKGGSFTDRIREISGRIAGESCQEIAAGMEYLKEGSFLEELDRLNMEVRLRETLADSIAYTVLKRCGIEEEELAEEISFPYIHEFNTMDVLSQLGGSVSDLSRSVLMEIRNAVREYNRSQERSHTVGNKNTKNLVKGIDNMASSGYHVFGKESGKQGQEPGEETGERRENNGTQVREERGLPNTDAADGRAAGGDTEEIRADEEALSERTQERSLHSIPPEREAESPLSGDTGAGGAEDGASDRADEEAGRRDRETQSGKPDAVGAEDEQ